jgi:hypothetical protein
MIPMGDDDEPKYTDWLANSAYGYGFGTTQEQALIEMAGYVDSREDPVTVDLVEHKGAAKVGPTGWQVEDFVSGERIKIPPEEFNQLRDMSVEAAVAVDRAVERAEEVKDLE